MEPEEAVETPSIQAPKQKRPLTEKQRANLEKGWEARRQLSAKVQEEKKLVKEELEKLELSKMSVKNEALKTSALKKANKIITEKVKMKKALEPLLASESDEEEVIVPVKPKKVKKPARVVYIEPESESEEEVITYKMAKKPSAAPRQQPREVYSKPEVAQTSRLVFF